MKHIVNPIPDSDWKCPNCGSEDKFYIEETADCGIPDCEGAHPLDVVVCHACDRVWSLQTIIKKWQKNHSVITCPTCKGTGTIQEKAIPNQCKDCLHWWTSSHECLVREESTKIRIQVEGTPKVELITEPDFGCSLFLNFRAKEKK